MVIGVAGMILPLTLFFMIAGMVFEEATFASPFYTVDRFNKGTFDEKIIAMPFKRDKDNNYVGVYREAEDIHAPSCTSHSQEREDKCHKESEGGYDAICNTDPCNTSIN